MDQSGRKAFSNMKHSIIYILSLCCLFLSFFVAPAIAFDDNGSKVVRVGYFEDNEGFQNGFSDQTPKSGYAYEYYQELAKYTGWTYIYVYGSWSDIYQMLTHGEVDIMGGMSKLDTRLPYMLFPEHAMGVESYYVFVPASDRSIHANDVTSLNGKRIGVNDNSYMLELFTRFVADNHLSCQIIPFPGSTDCMEALEAGALDGIVTVDNATINNMKPTFKIGSSNYYFAVNRKRPDILQELNDAQNKIFSTYPYYITSLQKKYFGSSIIREALSDDERTWLSQHPVLKLGYLKESMPYSGADKMSGALTGMLAEIIPGLEQFMGISLIPQGYDSVKALNQALVSGSIDLIFPAYGDMWYAENQDYILTTPIASDRMVLVYKGNFRDASYKRLAVSAQSAIQPFFPLTKYPDAEQISYSSLSDCLAAVDHGDADGMLISSNVFYRYLAENGQPEDLNIAALEDTVNYCFAVHRGSTTLYSIFNKALSTISTAKINNAILQNASVETTYSLKKFLKHYMPQVSLMLSALLLLLTLLFVQYRRKMRQNQGELQAAYETARKAARAKSDFLSTMSHDMRTPMNAIINLTSLAREDSFDSKKLSDDLAKIDRSNKFLLGLINDILDMSRIESGHIELHPSVCSTTMFEHYLESVIQPLCDSKGITFLWHKHTTEQFMYVDEIRFNQIFFNLLSNAVKYSHTGSSVTLRSENEHIDGNVLHIDYIIADQGIGMSEAFQKKLFQPFERENSSDTRMGTGLGLAITKRIIDEMKGTIHVTSVQGKGTTITVHLDLQIPTEAQLCAARQKEMVRTIQTPYDFSGRHILVVEDHPLNREIILRILEGNGLIVDVAEDGQAGLHAFEEKPPGFYDAIFMDVRMPVMDGLEATRRIRALPRSDAKTVIIIAMTAEAFEKNRKETLAAGMNEHLSKPIDPILLLNTLQHWLSPVK